MKKAAATKKTTTSEDDVQRRLAVFDARKQFLDSALNMSWQLALTFIICVFVGVELDNHFNSAPAWTIIGIFAGVILSVGIIKRTIQLVNEAQSNSSKDTKSGAKK